MFEMKVEEQFYILLLQVFHQIQSYFHVYMDKFCFFFFSKGMVDSPECVDLLISSGLSTDIQDQRGNTPTIVACFFNKPRILQSLVAANADLTLKNNEGKDAKAICEERDVPECLQIIEKK